MAKSVVASVVGVDAAVPNFAVVDAVGTDAAVVAAGAAVDFPIHQVHVFAPVLFLVQGSDFGLAFAPGPVPVVRVFVFVPAHASALVAVARVSVPSVAFCLAMSPSNPASTSGTSPRATGHPPTLRRTTPTVCRFVPAQSSPDQYWEAWY